MPDDRARGGFTSGPFVCAGSCSRRTSPTRADGRSGQVSGPARTHSRISNVRGRATWRLGSGRLPPSAWVVSQYSR
ncbi:hypothetical protein [Lysobacter gummosus]|uniref:hypothetical protein n=1 Tax=Lysobacter gummosus TaxID=262324 RepID=UPI003628622F